MQYPLESCSGHLERVVAKPHLEEIKQKVHNVIKKAERETGFETLEIVGIIRFAFATKSHRKKLDEWAASRGLRAGQLAGPAVDVQEFDRVSCKLANELKQVPSDRANVIVIYSHLFSSPPSDDSVFKQFIAKLADEVYKHPHVGYLVLIFNWVGENKIPMLQFQNHLCINRCRLYFNSESIMLFRNRFAANPMPASVEDGFLRAFKQIHGG
jgi:hypothetical protein